MSEKSRQIASEVMADFLNYPIAECHPDSKGGSLVQEGIKRWEARHTFPLGTRVTKLRGSSWTGRVVGHYSSSLTTEGVVVESEREPGSCQLYPNSAMRAMGDDE